MKALQNRIFSINSEADFQNLALEVFAFQSEANPVYNKYLKLLGVNPAKVSSLPDLPFLPIEFFKTHEVICRDMSASITFESSGTTGQVPSRHLLASEKIYQESFTKAFSTIFRKPEDLCILALLPSYLERGNSSLVYMMDHLINKSNHPESGFYLNNFDELIAVLHKRNKDGHQTLLLGVSFALLDLAEKYALKLENNISIMETGGMKGRRKEMIREELHNVLKVAFEKSHIYSEYGMTELLSQAYLAENGRFIAPPWMKIMCRDLYEPQKILEPKKSGAINVIDLANLYSCSFIATGDVGTVLQDGSFEINGRFDNAEIRGCNLMVL